MATQSYNGAPQSSALVALALAVNSVVSVTAAPVGAATVSLTLSGSAASVRAAAVSSAACNVVLTGATASLQANPIVAVAARFSLSGATTNLTASPTGSFKASFPLSGVTADVKATPAAFFSAVFPLIGSASSISVNAISSFSASADLTGASDSHGMSVCDVIQEMLGLWGMFCRDSAPEFALERALNDLNASLQTVWNHADERNYWSSDTLTLTLADGASSQDLGDDIQNVVGPCRRADNRRPLALIGTIGELETFTDIYLDGESAVEPLAYHIERMNQLGNDPAKCVFHVVPPVSGDSMSFLLEVVKEAPRFNRSDLTTCPIIPIPHRYVETLLLPIAKYHASSFSLFIANDQRDAINRDYQQARIDLGLADPLPGKSGDNLERREEKP